MFVIQTIIQTIIIFGILSTLIFIWKDDYETDTKLMEIQFCLLLIAAAAIAFK